MCDIIVSANDMLLDLTQNGRYQGSGSNYNKQNNYQLKNNNDSINTI